MSLIFTKMTCLSITMIIRKESTDRSDVFVCVCFRDWNATSNVRVQESWPTWASFGTANSNLFSTEGSGSLIVSRLAVSFLFQSKERQLRTSHEYYISLPNYYPNFFFFFLLPFSYDSLCNSELRRFLFSLSSFSSTIKNKIDDEKCDTKRQFARDMCYSKTGFSFFFFFRWFAYGADRGSNYTGINWFEAREPKRLAIGITVTYPCIFVQSNNWPKLSHAVTDYSSRIKIAVRVFCLSFGLNGTSSAWLGSAWLRLATIDPKIPQPVSAHFQRFNPR